MSIQCLRKISVDNFECVTSWPAAAGALHAHCVAQHVHHVPIRPQHALCTRWCYCWLWSPPASLSPQDYMMSWGRLVSISTASFCTYDVHTLYAIQDSLCLHQKLYLHNNSYCISFNYFQVPFCQNSTGLVPGSLKVDCDQAVGYLAVYRYVIKILYIY